MDQKGFVPISETNYENPKV